MTGALHYRICPLSVYISARCTLFLFSWDTEYAYKTQITGKSIASCYCLVYTNTCTFERNAFHFTASIAIKGDSYVS